MVQVSKIIVIFLTQHLFDQKCSKNLKKYYNI